MTMQYPLATEPTGTELRAALLPAARATLDNPKVREAYELFVKTAANLEGVGSIFEMMLRPEASGGVVAGRQAGAFVPRQLTVFANPEPALGPGGLSVVMTGGMYWEFLPGCFYANGKSFDGRSVAMDVTSFQTIETIPSGDAEVVGRNGRQPITKYVRVDVTCGDLSTSVAISNIALAGQFVAAYRNYIEVLVGRPYKEVHPYRDLNAPPIRQTSVPSTGSVPRTSEHKPSQQSSGFWKPLTAAVAFVALVVFLGQFRTDAPSPPLPNSAIPTSPPVQQSPSPPVRMPSAPVREARTRQGSNVRSGPSGETSIVRTVPAGTALRILETVNGWHRVSLGSDAAAIGWVHRSLMD